MLLVLASRRIGGTNIRNAVLNPLSRSFICRSYTSKAQSKEPIMSETKDGRGGAVEAEQEDNTMPLEEEDYMDEYDEDLEEYTPEEAAEVDRMLSKIQPQIRHPSLVNAKWLSHNQMDPNFKHVILNTSWYMPKLKIDVLGAHQFNRIPGSKYFSIDECADKSTDLPHMLPKPHQFEEAMRELGIDNGTHVILYDTNPHFMASARVWWMLRYFGHDNCSLLEHGLDGWIAAGYPTDNTPDTSKGERGSFTVSQTRTSLLKTVYDVKKNIKTEEFLLLDARSVDRFKGVVEEPRPNLQRGHVPGSINLPYTDVLDGFGSFKHDMDLRKSFVDWEINIDQPIAVSCGSGVTAPVVAFGLHLLGKSDVAIYDGSWSEYGHKLLELPVETGKL